MMVFLGILLFAGLVIAHEFGHFMVARRNGVEVEEFGIGFPPKLFGKKFGDTLYTFNLLPLGGFVKLKGETDSDRRAGSFGAAGLYAKAKILLAGVGMNLVACAVIVLLLALSSLPSILPGQYQVSGNQMITSAAVVVAQVVDGSAAAEAGLATGDELVALGDVNIDSAEGLQAATGARAGQTVALVYTRDDNEQTAEVTLGTSADDGYLGVVPIDLETSRYTWAAPLVAVGITAQMVWLVAVTLVSTISGLLAGAGGAAAESLTGPVGIVFLLQNLGEFGVSYLLFLMASISVSLAVFNVLPIPALDGGRLALIAGARMLGKPLPAKIENAVHGAGFVALLGLFILITYVDIQRFF